MNWVTLNGTTDRWNKPEYTAAVQVLQQGTEVPEYLAGVKATTYMEAFEKVYGRPYVFPVVEGQLRKSNAALA